MKSRTLPALQAFFEVAARRMRIDGGSSAALRAATIAVEKLTRFARIYPIGRPYKAICQGDLHALGGRQSQSIDCWRAAYRGAMALELPVVGIAAVDRLRATSSMLNPDDLSAANALSNLLVKLEANASTRAR
jgi:hypothetical protein